MRKRGFTLIELIVVMAIIAILILLGVPKYREYTKEAQLTKIKVNVKELESASMQYYMKYNDWPRLSDEPYTSEQIEDFGKQILDKTGATIVLESDGKYYDIDFSKVDNYIKLPDDNVNYILQNPIGKVFYIEGITKEAKERIPDGNDNNEESETPNEPEVPEEPITPIIFHGLSPEVFDKDSSTGTSLKGDITWEGNLANKKVIIDMKGGYQYLSDMIILTVLDANGNKLDFTNLTKNTVSNSLSVQGKGSRAVTEIIVPEGAVKFKLVDSSTNKGTIYDIYVSQ